MKQTVNMSYYFKNFFFLTLLPKIFLSLTPFKKKFKMTHFHFWVFFLSFSPFPPFQMARMSLCLTRVQPSQADVIGRFFFIIFFRSRRLEWRD